MLAKRAGYDTKASAPNRENEGQEWVDPDSRSNATFLFLLVCLIVLAVLYVMGTFDVFLLKHDLPHLYHCDGLENRFTGDKVDVECNGPWSRTPPEFGPLSSRAV